jgi:uncharacterized protein YjbI with pentapeptide repeats
MRKANPKLSASKPISAFEKPLKADVKALFKGLSKGVGHAAMGKWEELGNDAAESLGALGLVTEPSELASLLIQRSLIRALFDLVGEIAGQYLTEVKAEATKVEEQLNFSVSAREIFIDQKFLDRPADLPLLADVTPLLKAWLKGQGVPEASAEAVVQRLPSYFVYSLNQEWRKNTKSYQLIVAAIDTPFSKAGEREWAWRSYTSLLEKRIHESIFDEPFSLSQLYVPLNAFFLEDATTNAPIDGLLRGGKCERKIIVSLEKELQAWLEKQDGVDAIRVVSGGPGSGKSSFARIFAAKVAQEGKVKVLFVPLHLIDATKNLVDEVGRFTRDEGVLQRNPLDPDSPEPSLFIIFDGLDELASQGKAAAETARAFIREVDRTVEKRNLQGPRLRVLISGRELVVQENESELRRPRQILNLLPYFVPANEREKVMHQNGQREYSDPNGLLKSDLRSDWWKRYGELTGKGFKGLPKELDRHDLAEVTAQPLLNYLVALSFTRGKINFSKNINLNLIYSDLVSAVYQRGYEKKRTYGPIRHMALDQFSRVLEEVGLAAWHGDGRSTTVTEIEEHCNASGVGGLLEAFQEGAKVGVTRLLAAFFFRQHGQRSSGDPTFVFTHKSFGEYLTARRVIRATERVVRESLKRQSSPDEGWDEKDALRHWLQVCGPSPISPYLHKFLLDEVSIGEVEESGRWQKQLTNLFTYVLRHSLPVEQLQSGTFREAMFRARNAEEALLVVLNACARRTQRISAVQHADPTAFGAWFKRIQGQRAGSESSLAARCLSFMNLAGTGLDIADLYAADLQHSDLSGVAGHLACLERANLRSTNLSGAKLWKSNLCQADLTDAKLTSADLTEANLRHAIFEGVKLGDFRVLAALTEDIMPPAVGEQVAAQALKEQKQMGRQVRRPNSPETPELPLEAL